MESLLLTQADDGHVVAVRPGQPVLLRLLENPSTGYGWRVVQAVPDLQELYEATASGAVGSAGVRTFTFLAPAEPEELSFHSVRDWTPEQVEGSFRCRLVPAAELA